MNSTTRLLVVSAHAADFVWRAAGAIAMVTKAGGVLLPVTKDNMDDLYKRWTGWLQGQVN
jgi:hypothetical protein